MAGVLTLAGATDAQALLAVAAYRLVATWLPCLAGVVRLRVVQVAPPTTVRVRDLAHRPV